MNRIVVLVLLVAIGNTARAQEQALEATPSTAEQSALETAKAAAEAAKQSALAAQAYSDALQKALATLDKAPVAPAVEEKVAEAAPPPPAWSYQLGVSLLSVTGNANALTGKLSGQAEGTFGKWGTKIAGGATYGQTTAATTDESEVTALNANLSAKGQRSVSKRFNTYLLGGGMTDHVANIEFQVFGEAGVGLVWFERVEDDFVKSKLSTDLGFRYTREHRFQYYRERTNLPNVDIYSPAIKASFRYALTKTAVFTEELEVLPDIVDTRNVRAVSTAAISAQIDKGIALSLGFKVRYIGVPAEGAKTTDTELAAGVTWAF